MSRATTPDRTIVAGDTVATSGLAGTSRYPYPFDNPQLGSPKPEPTGRRWVEKADRSNLLGAHEKPIAAVADAPDGEGNSASAAKEIAFGEVNCDNADAAAVAESQPFNDPWSMLPKVTAASTSAMPPRFRSPFVSLFTIVFVLPWFRVLNTRIHGTVWF